MGMSYNDWYIRAEQAWSVVADLVVEQSLLYLDEPDDQARYDEIQEDLVEWKAAADYAEQMMEDLDKCQSYPYHCQPAQELRFPL